MLFTAFHPPCSKIYLIIDRRSEIELQFICIWIVPAEFPQILYLPSLFFQYQQPQCFHADLRRSQQILAGSLTLCLMQSTFSSADFHILTLCLRIRSLLLTSSLVTLLNPCLPPQLHIFCSVPLSSNVSSPSPFTSCLSAFKLPPVYQHLF